jgi:LuxR family maltose regulon positive regulatory protein
MLALDFARTCGRAFAWYKIDASETEPLLFFRYLISSIQECRPTFSIKSLRSIEAGGQDDMSWLAEAFVYELAESEHSTPMLIVVEDLHLLSDAEWLVPFFSRLLPLLPADVHLLITSRNLPPAPLWRLRSKQSLVVIDEPALAFTNSEAVALFQTYGLSPEHASIALDHTHGRAAALDEAAVFLSRAKGAPVEAKPTINLSPTLDGATA